MAVIRPHGRGSMDCVWGIKHWFAVCQALFADVEWMVSMVSLVVDHLTQS